jgi:hypothetical protein
MTRGCWSFFSSINSLKRFSKAKGIEAVREHLRECAACRRRFVVVDGPIGCTIKLRWTTSDAR